MVWLATPFLFMLGFGLQYYFIHKDILSPTSRTTTPEQLVSTPESINQDIYNLCGPASLLYAYLRTHPNDSKTFIEAFQNNPPDVGLSLPTRCQNILSDLPIDLAIMMAMKHTFNHTGYHPISRSVEQIQGASFPKQMVDWMHFFEKRLNPSEHQHQLVDTTELRNSYGQPLSLTHQALLGGVYSKEHFTFNNAEEHFLYLLSWSQSFASIIMLMDINLCLKILGDNSPHMKLSLAGVEFSHYIYLHHITHHPLEQTVTIKIFTWGVCAEKTLPFNEFQDGFRGFLGWENIPKPTDSPSISDENARRSVCINIHNNFVPYYTSNQHALFSNLETHPTVTASSEINEEHSHSMEMAC